MDRGGGGGRVVVVDDLSNRLVERNHNISRHETETKMEKEAEIAERCPYPEHRDFTRSNPYIFHVQTIVAKIILSKKRARTVVARAEAEFLKFDGAKRNYLRDQEYAEHAYSLLPKEWTELGRTDFMRGTFLGDEFPPGIQRWSLGMYDKRKTAERAYAFKALPTDVAKDVFERAWKRRRRRLQSSSESGNSLPR